MFTTGVFCSFGFSYDPWYMVTTTPACFWRPNPHDYEHNLAFVELVLGPRRTTNDHISGGLGKDTDSCANRRWGYALELLRLDTGLWSAPELIHHCQGKLCCPGGVRETRHKLWQCILVSRLLSLVGGEFLIGTLNQNKLLKLSFCCAQLCYVIVL